MGQISKRLFWLPHTARWIWPCWDRMVETRTLMRYGSANVKKCHFWAAGTTLLKAAVVLEDMCAHTDMVPPPKAFNLSLEADWNHTANPSLISEWQALLFSSMSQKSGWLALFRWRDSDVFCSSRFRTKYPFILCQHKVSQEQLAITRSLAEKAGVPAQSLEIRALLGLRCTGDRKRRFSKSGPRESPFFSRQNSNSKGNGPAWLTADSEF